MIFFVCPFCEAKVSDSDDYCPNCKKYIGEGNEYQKEVKRMPKTLDKTVVLRLRCERLMNCLAMPEGADTRGNVTMVPIKHCVACEDSIVDLVELKDYEKPDVKAVEEKKPEAGT